MRELALARARPAACDHAVACEVTIEGLEVQADIGVYASECGVPQPLIIDVTIAIAPPAEDQLSATVDYASIARVAHALAAERIVLIETFAQRLARACLADPHALAAEVRVRKPRALPGCMAGTHVRLVRQ